MGHLIKILLVLGLMALMLSRPDIIPVILDALTDAYIAVTVFVAVTLAIFYLIEARFGLDTEGFLNKYKHFHVPIGAVLGALPGCGGAIIVVTQYVRGRISFGAVVAVLTSTMGDAAFLLLAREPLTGLAVMALGVVVGMISGYCVDAIHGQDFLRPRYENKDQIKAKACPVSAPEKDPDEKLLPLEQFWLLLIIPGFLFGILGAFQVDTDVWFGNRAIPEPTLVLGVLGAVLSVGMWLFSPLFAFPHTREDENIQLERNSYISSENDHPLRRVVRDTNFITAWVVAAFLFFEIFVFLSEIDLEATLQGYAFYVPMIAIFFGFIPGCGPQILVTTAYLNGIIPLSAQLGNAISNDGDALFPAIALAPKASIVATLYSGIPAFIVAYGYFFLFE